MLGCEEEIHGINWGMHQQMNEIYKNLTQVLGSQQGQIDHVEMQMKELTKIPNRNLCMLSKQTRKCELHVQYCDNFLEMEIEESTSQQRNSNTFFTMFRSQYIVTAFSMNVYCQYSYACQHILVKFVKLE